MSARRTPSTTSLSKYARGQPGVEDAESRSLDFCNAFWGLADGGFDVLLTRMRGATRTTEELRAFWKERIAIEEEYSKRISKLAKQALGRDEIGELRNSIDTLRLETDRQAIAHANVAQQMRKELEQPVIDFLSRLSQFKKASQVPVEKSFKAKQTQEAYVKKARQRYEDDCVRINSFTAQSTLVQGKDLDKVQIRLEKAKQTVQVNEREYYQFSRALADTTSRWEKEWKAFCDACQDFEEDRIEFLKDNIWVYANAISTVCVADDESCEKLRLALEQIVLEKDMENFVRDYGTGPQIPDPPVFVDYNTLEAGQRPAVPTWRSASFARSTNRVFWSARKQSLPEEEPVSAGNAGVGAGGGRSREGENGTNSRPDSAAAVKSTTTATSISPSNAQGSITSNGTIPPSQQTQTSQASSVPSGSQTASSQPPTLPQTLSANGKNAPSFRAPQTQDPHTEPIDPRAETMLKVGANAYPVNLGNDPQTSRNADVNRTMHGNVGERDDPLARQAAELRSAASGSVRKGSTRAGNAANSTRRGVADAFPQTTDATRHTPVPVASGSGSSTANDQPPKSPTPLAPAPISQTKVDYRTPGESVVGGPPPTARSVSPKPPTPSFMIPPDNRPKSPVPVEQIVSTYQQSFPGERRLSVSREPSVRRSTESERGPGEASGSGSVQRPVSPAREGHAGIGAHGSRSNSPQPVVPTPPVQAAQQQGMNYHAPPAQQGPARAASPLGIALDDTGNVAHDSLAERMYNQQGQQRRLSHYGSQPPQAPPQQPYSGFPSATQGGGLAQQSRQYPPQPPPPPQQPPQQPPPQSHQVHGRQLSGQYYNQQTQSAQQQAVSTVYNPYGSAQSSFGRPAPGGTPQSHQQYPSQPSQSQAQPPRGYVYPEQSQQPRPPYGGYAPVQATVQQNANGYQQPYRSSEYGTPQGYQQQQSYRAPSPAAPHRPVSPAAQPRPPTGQYTEEGEGVLFYVKALYDYQATIDEEFDFQAGDIIAVTATPEDGWWNGMLLDEMRRVPGKTVFPSNFVSYF